MLFCKQFYLTAPSSLAQLRFELTIMFTYYSTKTAAHIKIGNQMPNLDTKPKNERGKTYKIAPINTFFSPHINIFFPGFSWATVDRFKWTQITSESIRSDYPLAMNSPLYQYEAGVVREPQNRPPSSQWRLDHTRKHRGSPQTPLVCLERPTL